LAGRRCGRAEFLRDLRPANRRTHLGEQPVRLTELTLAGRFVAVQTCQLSAFDMEKRFATTAVDEDGEYRVMPIEE
jgi:hypothetical protein